MKPRPGGSPKKRARLDAIARGELTPDESNTPKTFRPRVALTPEVSKRVVTFVRAGNFIETAAAAAGVNRGTIRQWLERGGREDARIAEGHEPDPDEQVYRDFMLDVSEAQGAAEAHDVATIRRAGQDAKSVQVEYDDKGGVAKRVERTERGDWRALTWRLEHMHGDRYTQRIKIEVESQLNDALDYLEQSIPPEAYRHVIEALAKRAGPQAP